MRVAVPLDTFRDRLLAEILKSDNVGGSECLATQELERHWLRQIWSRTPVNAEAGVHILSRTCASRPLDALASTTLDLYAFTHVILYATDMGMRSAQWPRPVCEIVADAEAALAAAMDANNFDLAAELLWIWPMLGLPWSSAATFCFRTLTAIQDAHGFLPGPGYKDCDFDSISEEMRDEYVLRTSYHATFVMGFLCAAALRPGLAPPTAVTANTRSAGAIDAIMPLLKTQSIEARWQNPFLHLDTACRESLSEFVLTIALRRARASHDMALVRECLRVALHILIDGPAVHQALALLRRATILGQMSSANGVAIRPTATASRGDEARSLAVQLP